MDISVAARQTYPLGKPKVFGQNRQAGGASSMEALPLLYINYATYKYLDILCCISVMVK